MCLGANVAPIAELLSDWLPSFATLGDSTENGGVSPERR
jgi:hypothetical protein